MPFTKFDITVCKPIDSRHFKNPKTIGNKLRNRRLELGLLQKDVATIMDVSEDTVTNWENERVEPQINYYPKIIQFLTYFPFEINTSTLGGKIKKYRFEHGLKQEEFAKKLGITQGSVMHYERGNHNPKPRILKKINRLLN